jgi:hypothetical protein
MPKALVSLLAATLALTGLAGCGGNEGAAPETGTVAPETATVTPETGIDPGAGSQNFSVPLNGTDGGQVGSANVTAAAGDQVRVTIQVDAATEETLSATIRPGTCADEHGDETGAHELSDLEEGRSETLLDASMDELRTEPHAIVVGEHRGRDEYQACGELVGDATGG